MKSTNTFSRLFHTLALAAVGLCAVAQSTTLSVNNTNTPYSRYGVGLLNDYGFGPSRAMGGIGFALRSNRYINPLNPASYSAVDSLTFLMDAAVSLQMSRLSESGQSTTANNSSFDYIAVQFRLHPGLGITAGLRPFSNVGYNLGNSSYITDEGTGQQTAATYNYYGDGGIHQVFLGMGYEPVRNFSLGFNISYLFGSIEKASTVVSDAYSDGSVRKTGTMDVYDYKLDLGAQYSYVLDERKNKALTLGVTYSLGHELNTVDKSTTGESTQSLDAKLKLPHAVGAGLAYTDEHWTAGIDYSLQLWEQEYYEPLSYDTGIEAASVLQPLKNRHRIAAGAEWIPNQYSSYYHDQIRYRFGAHYTTPYYQIKSGQGAWIDGPKEWGVSAGVGLPLKFLNRSIVQITAQYVRTSLSEYVTDNTFRLTLGLTFNETWFEKWRVK
ncbi:MAG: hypothetical protein ACOYJE_02355 [Bacteroidaceae bacterium]|jgi:hypothetical protein